MSGALAAHDARIFDPIKLNDSAHAFERCMAMIRSIATPKREQCRYDHHFVKTNCCSFVLDENAHPFLTHRAGAGAGLHGCSIFTNDRAIPRFERPVTSAGRLPRNYDSIFSCRGAAHRRRHPDADHGRAQW